MHWYDEYCSQPEQGAYSPHAPVRALAARTQPLPLRTQMRLAHDPIPAVRQALAAHDPLPAPIIDELSWDRNDTQKQFVSKFFPVHMRSEGRTIHLLRYREALSKFDFDYTR